MYLPAFLLPTSTIAVFLYLAFRRSRMPTAPQDTTAKRIAVDILVAAIHNNRFYPPHYTPHEELPHVQTGLFRDIYEQLLEAVKNTRTKETTTKRAAADILVAAIHSGRLHPHNVSEEEAPQAQIALFIQTYQELVESLKSS